MNGDTFGWFCPLCLSSSSRMVESGGTAEWRRDSFMQHLHDTHNLVPDLRDNSTEPQRPRFLGRH